jgi:hypothetical protein
LSQLSHPPRLPTRRSSPQFQQSVCCCMLLHCNTFLFYTISFVL